MICSPCLFKDHARCKLLIASPPLHGVIDAEVCECLCVPQVVTVNVK